MGVGDTFKIMLTVKPTQLHSQLPPGHLSCVFLRRSLTRPSLDLVWYMCFCSLYSVLQPPLGRRGVDSV